jgi:uncharacterized protein YcfJ
MKTWNMKKLIMAVALSFALTVGVDSDVYGQTTTTKTETRTSKKKKGAIIGGVAGSATGAAISKKHGKGAIVGGVAGAGAGYLYGRHRDKKHPSKKVVTKTKTTY